MARKRLLKHLVFLMFFIFLVNSLALKFYWYYSIPWIDIPMHFLGGFWLGLFFIYVFYTKDTIAFSLSLFFKIILAALVIGILWELYEYYLNVISLTPFYSLDTLSDIFFDTLGSLTAIFYFSKIIMPVSINKL